VLLTHVNCIRPVAQVGAILLEGYGASVKEIYEYMFCMSYTAKAIEKVMMKLK